MVKVNRETRHPEKYCVGIPAAKGFNSDCFEFTQVFHTAHVRQALDIIRDKRIKSGLVYDESHLNDKRISVVWLSPNDWSGANGYRYGSIQFVFDWKSLIKDKNYYWVETCEYKIRACRILITDQNRDGVGDLIRYVPEEKNGPWWFDKKNNKHYYNNNICLELMFEQDIEIIAPQAINFVRHHKEWCSLNRTNPKNCTETDMSREYTGSLFLASLVANDLCNNTIDLIDKDTKKPKDNICTAWNQIREIATYAKIEYSGNLTSGNKETPAIARAILHAYAIRNNEERKSLQSLFQSKEELINALATFVEQSIGLPPNALIRKHPDA